MIDNSPLLVRTPLPKHYESLLGYTLRISEENGYQSPVEVAQLAGMGMQHVKSRYLPVHKLAPILAVGLRELDRYSYLSDPSDPTSKFKLNHHDLGARAQKYQLCTSPKICPHCIKEDGYIDIFWDLAISIACPRHSIKALFKCHKCNNQIEWTRPGLLLCKCGADYLEAPLEKASLASLELMQLIYAKVHDKSILGLMQESKFPLEKFEDIPLGQFLHMLHAFAFLSDKYQYSAVLSDYDYLMNIISCASAIFSDWPNGFVSYLQGENKLTYSNKPDLNFWRKFRGLYRALTQSSWFDRKCNFIFDELVIFGLKHMNASRYQSLQVEPIAQNSSSTPLAKRLNFKEMPDEVIQKLMQLKHILTNVAASGYLGLPRKVLERLDKEGVFDKFGIEGSCKTPCHPWNRDELNNIIWELKKIVGCNKLTKTLPKNTTHLSKVLARNFLDFEVKVSIVRDILSQKIAVYDLVGTNFSGLILDQDALSEYIFHRCPKNFQASISLLATSVKLGIPEWLVDSLIHLGFLSAIKPNSGIMVLQKSIDQFQEKFIGRDLLKQSLAVGEDDLNRKIEFLRIPTLDIPFGDTEDRYSFIPKIYIPQLGNMR